MSTDDEMEEIPRRPRTHALGDVKIEDVLGASRKRAKRSAAAKNSNRKGKNFEREVRDLLHEVYGEKFARVPGSGMFGTIMDLDTDANCVLAGDLIVGKMDVTVECKKGYDEVRWVDIFFAPGERGGKSSQDKIRSFIDQVEESAKKTHKNPLIVWSQTSKPVLCGIRKGYYEKYERYFTDGHPVIFFSGYVFFRFSEFLRIPKDQIFSQ